MKSPQVHTYLEHRILHAPSPELNGGDMAQYTRLLTTGDIRFRSVCKKTVRYWTIFISCSPAVKVVGMLLQIIAIAGVQFNYSTSSKQHNGHNQVIYMDRSLHSVIMHALKSI